MNILFVVESKDTPNYFCVKSVAEACSQYGHTAFILTQGDEKKTFANCNHPIKEYTVKPDFASVILLRLKKTIFEKVGKMFYKLCIFLLTPVWPIRAPLYVRRLQRKVNSIIDADNINIVVLTHVSIENLLVAQKRRNNVLYIGYFLDLLVGGMKLSYMKYSSWEKKTKRAEKKAMEHLDIGIMMESSRYIYEFSRNEYKYFEKLVFLDLPLLSKKQYNICNSVTAAKFFSSENINLLFVGSMAKNIRDPQYIMKLVLKLNNPNIRFYIVGNSDYCDEIKNLASLDNRIIYLGRQKHETSLQMIKEADFLVNIGNRIQNMVPSKIFEYMSYNKPIISTYKIDNDPCLASLKKYGLYLALDERIDLNTNAVKLEKYIMYNYGKRIDDKRFNKLVYKGGPLYKNTPEAFADLMNSLEKKSIDFQQ